MRIDRLDAQLLNLLQENASVSLRELSEKVHASPATCQRRIAQLMDSGVGIKQVLIVDRQLVGRALTVFVSVEMDKQNDALLRTFENTMRQEQDVMACYEVSGEFDFMLIVNSASMEGYHTFTRRVFSPRNNVRNFKSHFAMNCSKFETKIPIDPREH
jgi:Lrp/AsnC family transcriptional regulator, leucine-responsive regulatory protein